MNVKIFNKNNVSIFYEKKNLISFFIAIIIFILDRISKAEIINTLSNSKVLYINNYINFDLVWNTGIGFGLLSSESNLIYNSITLVIAIVIIFLIYLISRQNFFDKILFSLILGGAIGNFYDRLVYFAVPDFIDIHYNNFHWFTFNIADIFITIGIIILISKDIIIRKK